VAGLATITPAAGYVQPMAALAIGVAAGIVCYLAVGLKGRFGYDDSLDVVGVHMVGGILGVLLTGVFASLAVNAAGAAASLAQLGRQGVLAGVTVVFSFVATLAILKVTDLTVGLRVSEEHEDVGLDASQHGEVGYRF
jgi:Amt family ammonium transporter